MADPAEEQHFTWYAGGPRRRKQRPCAPMVNFNQSGVSENTAGMCSAGVEAMREEGCGQRVISDKFEKAAYHHMYGVFLWPLRFARHKVKLLEIGLGCSQNYEPGASATLWRSALPTAEVWMAEYDGKCVAEAIRRGKLPEPGTANPPGISVLIGDQSNHTTVRKWVETSGGDFDIVIDDGGHKNHMIQSSFEELWPALKPGGLYFIEDLQVGRNKGFQGSQFDEKLVISDVLKSWMDQLVEDFGHGRYTTKLKARPFEVGESRWNMSVGGPTPPGLAFMACFTAACVLGKACTS